MLALIATAKAMNASIDFSDITAVEHLQTIEIASHLSSIYSIFTKHI